MATSKGETSSERGTVASNDVPIRNMLPKNDGEWPSLLRCLAALLEEAVALLFSLRAHSPWLTVREAERYAHAPHGAIGEAIRGGELPAYQRRVGTVMLVDVDEVNGWIRDRWRVRFVDGEPRRRNDVDANR